MPTLKIDVTISGGAQVAAKLDRLGGSLTDFKSAMGKVGKFGKNYFSGPVFESEGEVLGQKWAPLNPKYEVRKAKKYARGAQILVASGTMRKKFYYSAGKQSVFIGNKDPKFPYHQLGTGFGGTANAARVAVARHLMGMGGGGSIGRGNNLPARPMIGINQAFETGVQDIIRKDIREKLAAA
jgi:phage gpG-like protein